ncbi:Calx-beta domain-containing protein, partial [Okeania sp. SIO2B9]|uniref:Calx-beta domain-containing protein n=1 Tax=Okeania sp. SIO2B9 TaxID=2607782 RepID=UPI0014299C50
WAVLERGDNIPGEDSIEPIVTINTFTPNITEGQTGQFFVNINSLQNNDIVVNYAVDGTATNGLDYTTIPLSVLIPAGSTSVPIDINAIIEDDVIVEPVETVNLTLQDSDTYNLGEINTALLILMILRHFLCHCQ